MVFALSDIYGQPNCWCNTWCQDSGEGLGWWLRGSGVWTVPTLSLNVPQKVPVKRDSGDWGCFKNKNKTQTLLPAYPVLCKTRENISITFLWFVKKMPQFSFGGWDVVTKAMFCCDTRSLAQECGSCVVEGNIVWFSDCVTHQDMFPLLLLALSSKLQSRAA